MTDLVRKYEQTPIAAKFFGALFIIGSSAYVSWEEFVVPKVIVIEEKLREQEKMENELKEINKDFISPVTMEEELSAANREFKKLIELLPQEPSVDRVLNDFASLSRLTGTEIREFRPGSELSASTTLGQANTQPLPVQIQTGNNNNAGQNSAIIEMEDTNAIGLNMKMFGTFTALVSFLDMAMALPRVVRIQDFEIINTDREVKLTQKPKLTFNGVFHAYFQKPNSAPSIPVANTPVAKATNKPPSSRISKPAIDLNNVLDKSFSSKPIGGEKE